MLKKYFLVNILSKGLFLDDNFPKDISISKCTQHKLFADL